MTTIDRKRRNNSSIHMARPALSLVLLSVLSACGDTGVGDSSSSSDAAESQSAPFEVTPSLGSAQLASDNTITVQTAITADSPSTDTTTDSVGAPAAANPDASVNSPTVIVVPDGSGTDEQDAQPDTTDTASNGNTGAGDAGQNQDTVQSESNTETSDASGSSDPANSGNFPEEETPETSFSSVTTQGFEGEVLDDSIRITWPELETARGYNVYRQAAYYATVFTTEFIDTEVFDDDYYYEIQAFDNDDNFEYVATGLTVSASTFGRTDPEAPQPNDNLLDNYELVFSEEFQGMELDTSKWNTSFLWGPDLIINGEEQYYVDIKNDPDFGFNPFTFDGEYMTINTIETPDNLLSKANNQAYLSGIITSYDAMKFTYGYFETRAKFTHGRGYWPAFWLLNAYYGGADPEIDIMEFIGQNQDVVYHTYHYFDSNGELRSTESFPVVGIDFTADFHTFGVEWKPGTIIFYVDNYETLRISDANVSQEEMYILINTAVGGWWAGSPDFTTPFPGKYVIDYVRAYQSTVQYDEIQFDQPDDLIPLFSDDPGKTTPNHKPPFWLWPEGYPGKQ